MHLEFRIRNDLIQKYKTAAEKRLSQTVHRRYSVVVPQCYQQNLFYGDPSLMSLCEGQLKFFMLLCRKILTSFVLCSVLFNLNFFLF